MDATFYILDGVDYHVKYILDRYTSVLWADKYDEPGTFEVVMYPYEGVVKNIQVDDYIYNPHDEVVDTMIIEEIDATVSENGEKVFKFSGRSLEIIIARRGLFQKTLIKNGLQDAIRQLIKYNFAQTLTITNTEKFSTTYSDDASDRVVTTSTTQTVPIRVSDDVVHNFVFVYDSTISSINIDEEIYNLGSNILDIIMTNIKNHNLGFYVKLCRNRSYQYETTEKTLSGDFVSDYNDVFVIGLRNNHPIQDHFLFSDKFENLISSEYKNNISDSKNIVYMFGKVYDANENANHNDTWYMYDTYLIDEESKTHGIFRKECIKQESVNVKVVDGLGTEKILTETEYRNSYKEKAIKALYDSKKTVEFNTKIIEQENGIKYGRDYTLGSTVNVVDAMGNAQYCLVSEYVTQYDQNGINSYPTFRLW